MARTTTGPRPGERVECPDCGRPGVLVGRRGLMPHVVPGETRTELVSGSAFDCPGSGRRLDRGEPEARRG